MKKFVAGLLVGVLVSTGFAYAAQKYTASVVPYKILVNGKVFTNTDKPAVNIDGSTYLPLRAMGEALNVAVNWNAKLKQVEIGDMNGSSSQGVINAPNAQIKFSKYSSIMGYRIFDVEIKNTGTTEMTYDPADFKCDGNDVNSKVSIENAVMLQSGKLLPGSSISGKVAFISDGDATKTSFSLSYKGSYRTTFSSK
jgi:archaellum component FlaF (FlaF/FlaG flagellin family)